MGTEKVETYLQQRFPGATIGRMDRDIIRRPADYSRILGQFGRGEIDILVGTQMLAKGHDYPNVTTIVTLGVDSILRLPDFRHSERVFQLLTQVSGRAGRGENPGTVFLCTYKPEHFAIKAASELDFASFYETEFEYRRSLGYPPFGYLTLITFERYDKRDALALATSVMEKLHSALGTAAMILGPSLAPYARLRNRWRYQLIVKSLDRIKTRDELHRLRKSLKNPLEIKIVVDPVSVM
jgi:primosomal protein N' (replication factor Y)